MSRKPKRIVLAEEDVRMGIGLELEAKAAQARLQALCDAAQLLRAQMYAKYNVSESEYQLADWLTGFQPVEGSDA